MRLVPMRGPLLFPWSPAHRPRLLEPRVRRCKESSDARFEIRSSKQILCNRDGLRDGSIPTVAIDDAFSGPLQ